MADAADLKSAALRGVRVRLPPEAPRRALEEEGGPDPQRLMAAARVSNPARSLNGSSSVAEGNRVERSRFIAAPWVSRPVANRLAVPSKFRYAVCA